MYVDCRSAVTDSLDDERAVRLQQLRELEAAERAQTVNELQTALDEDIARIRLNHLQCLQIQLWKIRARFAAREQRLNDFFERERSALRDMWQRFQKSRIDALQTDVERARDARTAIFRPNHLIRLTALATDFQARKFCAVMSCAVQSSPND
jgi:hypothetical protein